MIADTGLEFVMEKNGKNKQHYTTKVMVYDELLP